MSIEARLVPGRRRPALIGPNAVLQTVAVMEKRLRDAMALVAHHEGMQVHRSWWVARGGIENVQRDGRNIRLILARGIAAPVARAKVADLRKERWL